MTGRFVGAALALWLSAGAANASAGLSCEADDDSVSFAIEAGVTRGMGSPLFSFGGELAVKAEGAADDLRRTSFELQHVAQYWLDGEELKLLLYREREGSAPHGYVELVIETTADGDDIGFSGRYAITIFDVGDDDSAEPVRIGVEGTVSCSVG